MVTIRPPKTIVKPTALGPVANTDTKLLIYGLFQRGRVLAQDAEASPAARNTLDSARIPRASKLLICGLFQKGRVLAQDAVHRGGQAFVVALGVDREGKKLPLGFWEGATENHEICEELLEELERRGLKLSKRILWVTDGGGGIIKALKDRYGKKLIHQRCTLHKDRNIQRHLPKRYRKQAHHLFATALEQNSYKDAKKMLQEFERWLRDINESAADSLLEALEEVLMLHKLKVPALLRQSLHSTNPIESMFSMVRSCERNIKRYRNSKMRQRWLAAVLLHCELQFRRVKGHASIDVVVAAIDAIQREDEMPEAA